MAFTFQIEQIDPTHQPLAVYFVVQPATRGATSGGRNKHAVAAALDQLPKSLISSAAESDGNQPIDVEVALVNRI